MRTVQAAFISKALPAAFGDGANLCPQRGITAIDHAVDGGAAKALEGSHVALQQVDHAGRPSRTAGQLGQRKNGRGGFRARFDDQRGPGHQCRRNGFGKSRPGAASIENDTDHASLPDHRTAQASTAAPTSAAACASSNAALLTEQLGEVAGVALQFIRQLAPGRPGGPACPSRPTPVGRPAPPARPRPPHWHRTVARDGWLRQLPDWSP